MYKDLKGGAKSATLVEIGLRSNFRVVLYKNSCYVKRSALPLFCSCDQNPWKIPGKELSFNKVTAFNFIYLTTIHPNTSYFIDIFPKFWPKMYNIKFKEHLLVVISLFYLFYSVTRTVFHRRRTLIETAFKWRSER